jgi:hypothetical protein
MSLIGAMCVFMSKTLPALIPKVKWRTAAA